MTDILEPENPLSQDPPIATNADATSTENSKSIGYVVSNTKFWVMNICTMGVYAIYWAYKNFLALELAKPKHPRIFAFIHAIFLFISLYRLLGLIEDAAKKGGSSITLSKILLSVLFFFSPVVDFIFFKHDDYTWMDVTRLLVDTLILFQVQWKILKINKEIHPELIPTKKFGKKEIVFCSLGIIGYIIIAIAAFLPNDQSFQYSRWHFVDKTNEEQWKNKEEKLALINSFWNRFAKEENQIRITEKGKAAKDQAKSWIADELSNIDPNIEWDLRVDPEKPTQNILILTSRLHWGNRPLIEDMISLAPKIKNWKFMTSRPKAPLYMVGILLDESGKGPLNNFSLECRPSKEHLINVIYKESNLTPQSTESRKKGLEIVDLLIGQENEDQWIGWLDTEKSAKVQDKEEAGKKFIADFIQLKEKLLLERFDKPIAQMTEEEKQSAYDVLYDAYSSYPFDSRRFSKFDEKFCYLTVKKENTFKTPEAIQNTINELDKALRAEKCGCTLGGTFDQDDRFYFDLCLTDIDKSAKVLQQFTRKNKYGKDAWLEFYDDTWISEWIGMEPDSAVPEMRNPDRLPK